MTIRSRTRLISFSLAVVLTLSAVALINMSRAQKYKNELETSYQHSLNELSESLDSVETNLTKCVYSSSDKMLGELCSELYSDCTRAKEALSRLPAEQMELDNTYKFITQAADYAAYVSEKTSQGEEITNEEHESLVTLLGYAARLNDSVEDMVDICNSGARILSKNVTNSQNVPISPLSKNMSSAGEAFKDYPTLLYDGPFADAVLNREVQMTKGKELFTRDEAKQIAADAIGKSAEELSFSGDEDGRIPAYVFTCSQQTVAVTKYGGYVSYILYGGRVTETVIDEKNAVNIAKKYLDSLGYERMTQTYYMTYKNICTINFAYRENGVTYYSDLIKVGVSMKDGTVVSMEAKGYLTNHTDRAAFEENITLENAIAGLNPYLELLSDDRCVIPLENGQEAQCYELHCRSTDTNEEVLIYVNTLTGDEENILLLLYSDNGTLTK